MLIKAFSCLYPLSIPKAMLSNPVTHINDQMIAMHDASVGAFEAARVRFEKLRAQTESVSIDYVCGRTEKTHVRSVAEQFLLAESALREASARVQMSQDALQYLTSS